jgi:molybdenum cofactor biosynthesis protein B
MTQSLTIAVLTVSDTRTEADDRSGQSLIEKLQAAGHQLAQRVIVRDDIYKIRAQVSNWIADERVQAVLVTGGTGFAKRDVTPDALTPLFDKTIDGFGELFRAISVQQIGSSAIQSRAVAGVANKTIIFGLPGSPNACRTAWDDILVHQLDSTHKPCNFVSIIFNDPT